VAMRLALLLWPWLLIQAWGGGFGFLELRPAEGKGDSLPSIPLYLAFPDTLGSIPVRAFLEAPPKKADALLHRTLLNAKPLSKEDEAFLVGARDIVEGRVGDARNAFAIVAKHPPRRLVTCLKINTAFMLYLIGLPSDAERGWRESLEGGDAAAEGAWRSLYSLYLGRKDFAKAHGLVEEALQESPKNKWAVAAKGYLMRMLKPEDDLGAFLKEKASWKDSLFGMQIAYGKFLKDREEWEEAAKYYNRGLEGDPKNGQAWLELADIYYHMGYLAFSETCILNAFKYGISDTYVYELYGRVLQDFSEYIDGRVMIRFDLRIDPQWAERQRLMAEKIIEEGLPHDIHSRSMAQLLYRLYCLNGKVDAAETLREGFWFHFIGPVPPSKPPRLGPKLRKPSLHLPLQLSYVTYPLVSALQSTDFYEPF
jgi:tetratricopeptide (TPR) repeat protein